MELKKNLARTSIVIVCRLVLAARAAISNTMMENMEYKDTYLFFETVESKNGVRVLDFNLELRKDVKGKKQKNDNNPVAPLSSFLPQRFKSIMLCMSFKQSKDTGEVLTISIKDLQTTTQTPKKIEQVLNVGDLTGKKAKPNEPENQKWRPVIITIGRDLELRDGEKEEFKIMIYYPDSAIDLPWRRKVIAPKDAKNQPLLITSQGIDLNQFLLAFKYKSNELRNIKLFFDSYIGATIDEIFLSTFFQAPTELIFYVPFNFVQPQKTSKSESDLQVLEFENIENGTVVQKDQTKSKNGTYRLQPEASWTTSHKNYLSPGNFLILNYTGTEAEKNLVKPSPFEIDVAKCLQNVRGDSNIILNLNDKAFFVSFWFMINIEKNYNETFFQSKKKILSYPIFNLKLGSKILGPNVQRNFHHIRVWHDMTTAGRQGQGTVGPMPVRIEFNNNSKSVNVSLTEKNVNNPFNNKYQLSNKKWYFLTAKTSKTHLSSGTIQFELEISNPREAESLLVVYPGIEDDAIDLKFNDYFEKIEFAFVGKLAQLRVLQGGLDLRNAHNSLFQSGLRIDFCEFGYNFRRIRANLYHTSQDKKPRYQYEEQKECYNCLTVSTNPVVHSKKVKQLNVGGEKEFPLILDATEEISLIWDGDQCATECPLGFRVNYRAMKCEDCFKNKCMTMDDLLQLSIKVSRSTAHTQGQNIAKSTLSYKDSNTCGDDIVEYDKGEDCDGAIEGCDNTKCKIKQGSGFICYSPLLGNSRCARCDELEIEELCRNLYNSVEKTFSEKIILQKCIEICNYGEGFYPIKGFIRTSMGKQTYKNTEGEELLCFLGNLNIKERGRIINWKQERNGTMQKMSSNLPHNISDYCKDQCKLTYRSDLDLCFGFHPRLGYKQSGSNSNSIVNRIFTTFSTFLNLIIVILAILSLLFLAPTGNIHLFFMMIDLLQLYHIWGLRAPKSFEKKVLLKSLNLVSFDWFYGWIKSLLMGNFFDFKNYHILNYDAIEKVSDSIYRQDNNFISHWEDFMQYDKTGYFILDASNITEIYIYYLILCLILSFFMQLAKRFMDKRNIIRVIYTNVCRYFISRKFLFRIFNESYVYLFLYGLYMELNIDFPKRNIKGAIFINYWHVVMNKVFQRIVLCCVGIGFPTYLIARLTIYGKGEKVDRDLNFMVAGCKGKSYSARIIPVFVIIRKILVVFYVLPCFMNLSLGISLLIIGTQVVILCLLINGMPFEENSVNCIAIFANLIFFLTSFIFFINSIIHNFLQLTYITSEDYSARPDMNFQSSYIRFDETINNAVTMITITLIVLMFATGILSQVFLQIRYNKEFYGSIISNSRKTDDDDDDLDEDGLGMDKVFELVAL